MCLLCASFRLPSVLTGGVGRPLPFRLFCWSCSCFTKVRAFVVMFFRCFVIILGESCQ